MFNTLGPECPLLFQREVRLANSQDKPCSKFGSSVGAFQLMRSIATENDTEEEIVINAAHRYAAFPQ